jgi:hypothetical protein
MSEDDPLPGEHDLWEALAVGSAMHALEPEDDARFRDHLRGCARCAAVVRESAELVTALAAATERIDPPAGLRDRITAISRDDGARVAPVVADEVGRRRDDRRTPSTVIRWAVAAAIVSALASSGVTYALVHHTPGPGRAIAFQCFMDSACQHIPLVGKNGAIGAVLLDGDKAYVMTPTLPRSGDGDEYVVWKGDSTGRMTAVAAFRVTSGDAVHPIDWVPDLTGVAAMAISREARSAHLPAQPSTPLGIATVPPSA